MFSPIVAIPAFLLLTFIYIISIFFRSNNHSKDARKRPPGPLALPLIGNIHLLGTLPHRKLQSLANKYGPIMSLWLGPVVSSSEAAELFLKTHDPAFASRRTNQATDHLLNMVIKESLRLYPAGPFVPRECVQDCVVDGYYIQKKSRILLNAWAIGRDPKIWSDNAHMFYPERFLNSDIDLQGNHFQLIPFGAGCRKCPGLQIGLTIIKLVVAQLVHCFDWNLPNGMSPCDLDMSETFGRSIPRSKSLLSVPTLRSHCKAHD